MTTLPCTCSVCTLRASRVCRHVQREVHLLRGTEGHIPPGYTPPGTTWVYTALPSWVPSLPPWVPSLPPWVPSWVYIGCRPGCTSGCRPWVRGACLCCPWVRGACLCCPERSSGCRLCCPERSSECRLEVPGRVPGCRLEVSGRVPGCHSSCLGGSLGVILAVWEGPGVSFLEVPGRVPGVFPGGP